MIYLFWQTLFWIALAVTVGILIGWWVMGKRTGLRGKRSILDPQVEAKTAAGDAQIKLNQTMEDLRRARDHLTQATAENERLQSEIAQIKGGEQAWVGLNGADITDDTETVAALQHELEEYQQKCKEERDKSQHAAVEISRLEAELESAVQYCHSIERQAAQWERECDDLLAVKARFEELEAENQRMRSQAVASNAGDSVSSDNETSGLAERHQLQAELERARDGLAAAREREKQHEHHIARLERDLQAATAERYIQVDPGGDQNDYQAEYRQAEHERSQLETELARMSEEVDSLKEQLAGQATRCKEQSAALEQAHSALEQAGNANPSGTDHAQRLEANRAELEQLAAQLQQFRSENDSLHSQLDKLVQVDADQPVAAPAAEAASGFVRSLPDDAFRPAPLHTPEGGRADDLTLIKGIGPKISKTLFELGVFHFHQIADFSRENIEWVDGFLRFKGRIDREQWVQQARILATGAETEYSRKNKTRYR